MAESRALATIERIASISPIEGADAIETASVRGWEVVVKKGEFAVGDLCVYFEVDSMLDVADPRFTFLAPRGLRKDTDGFSGHVLKTARLRGQYSQGLVIPFTAFPELAALGEGSDVTDALRVRKWDPPMPASLAGVAKSTLPSWISKTDEERLQNVEAILGATHVTWTATEKIDGSSATFYLDGDVFGVCSRNLDLFESEDNTLWALARKLDIEEKLRATGLERVAVQGEAFGEGIQKNPLGIKGARWAAFTMLDAGTPRPRHEWPAWLLALSVPELPLTFPKSLDEALAQVEKMSSAVSPDRKAEGVVWRSSLTSVQLPESTIHHPETGAEITIPGKIIKGSFKVISRSYLLKHDT